MAMVGYLAPTYDPDLTRRFETLATLPSSSGAHREHGFAVALTAPAGGGPVMRAHSDLATDQGHVLAFEGYLCGLPNGDAVRPAAWLLERYARMGLAAFDYLNGAYAICLYDRQARRAWLAACSFGRRDMYYSCDGGAVLFATDLEGVVRLAAHPPALAADQLASSFLGGALFGEATLLRGIRRVVPGAVIDIQGGTARSGGIAPLAPASMITPQQEPDLLDALDASLRTATRRLAGVTRQQAVLMGAGVDSGLAAAYVKAVTGRLVTITQGMPTPPEEVEGAKAITEALGGTHHVSRADFDAEDMIASIDGFVRVMEEPISFGLGLLMVSLARNARRVADGFVCGSSADTLFGDPVDGFDDEDPDSTFHYVFREMDAYCVRQVVRLSRDFDNAVPRMRAQLSRDPERQPIHLMMLMHTLLMVRGASRLARAQHGEALFPYLDRDVVHLAFGIPLSLRTNQKPLLRALAARHFSAALLPPGKMPFTFYPIKWLQKEGALHPLLDLLDEPRTRTRGVYREKNLHRMVEAYRTGQPTQPWRNVLWQVVAFELFCRRFIDAGGLPPLGDERSVSTPMNAAIS
jgi:asparagine synthase (glutamine-hydrolysing)